MRTNKASSFSGDHCLNIKQILLMSTFYFGESLTVKVVVEKSDFSFPANDKQEKAHAVKHVL